MKKQISLISVIILIVLLAGCTSFVQNRKGIEECEFELKSAKLGKLTLTGVRLKLGINIHNPNNHKVVVDRFDYEIFANNKFIAKGSNRDKFTVQPGSDYMFKTKVFLGYNNLGDFVKQLVKSNKVKYKVKGTVYLDTPLGTIKYPIEITKVQ